MIGISESVQRSQNQELFFPMTPKSSKFSEEFLLKKLDQEYKDFMD